MIRTHLENKADVTIAALPVAEDEAQVVRHHADRGRRPGHRLRGEAQDPREARAGSAPIPTGWSKLGHQGRRAGPTWPAWASTCSTARPWSRCSPSSDATDFGHELFPQAIANHRVQAHLFDGYWEDIGTVGAFHKANIDLTRDDPPFDFTFGEQPIFTRPRYLPCSRISRRDRQEQPDLPTAASSARGSVIENSVIGVRSQIGENVTIRNTYIMGADCYEQPRQLDENAAAGRPNIGIGAGSVDRERDHRQERPDRPQRRRSSTRPGSSTPRR